ncbi:G-protein coupled receptor dmsr-1 [Onthophagus taurus]|uniref:G-protein coupled receptor dmsr-1 n=1 Tax=Onthophagus taurus TaxID=166361 RepID=UPI000C1FE0C1|nr:probable G-protein coupled receptor 139 [Onthophagus taurus]
MSEDLKYIYIKNITIMTQNNIAIVSINNKTFEIHGLENLDNNTDYEIGMCNVCNSSITSYVQIYAEYHGYLAFIVCIFGTIANIFNIIVLTRKEMACVPINRILTGLAVTDMLLMVEYMIFAYYYHAVVMKEYQFPYWGAVFMLVHIHFTQIAHTVSICLTLTLAVWRYLAIGYPERSSVLCSETRCTIAICLSYVLPIILCIPTYFAFSIKGVQVEEDGKFYVLYTSSISSNENFIIFNLWTYAVVMKLFPCLILTVISAWLIKTLYKAKKRKKVLKSYNQIPKETVDSSGNIKKKSKAERRAERTTKMLVAVLILFLITEFPQGIFGLLSGLKGKCFFLSCYQEFGDIMDMLALLNGSINFILYCSMNRMFRVMFGQMFRKRIFIKLSGKSRNTDAHTTTTAMAVTNTTEI